MVIGIDEVGRGCWAGPLVAAAVGFEEDLEIPGLTDSKKLSAKKRLQLVKEIQNTTSHIGVGWVWPSEINELGLTISVHLAMKRAVRQLKIAAKDHIIIDGNINYLKNIACKDESCNRTYSCGIEAIVGADGSIPAVSAASVIAKVARDTYMIRIAEKYPEYGFETHVGYGTKAHINALRRHGVLSLHRVNYKPIKRLLSDEP